MWMEKLEAISDSERGVVGGRLSLADVTLYVFVREFFDAKAEAAASIANCPKIAKAIDAVAGHPRVHAYLRDRKITKM